MLFTSVLFISCEQDDVILEQQQNDKPVFHSSTFKLNKENLPDGVKKSLVASKKQLGISQDFAKSTYDSLSGFWIDETSVNHTVSGEYESYTFNIVHNDSTKLKNIFFSKELDSSYTSYLVTYDLNFIDMNDLINGNVIHKIDHIEYRKIESDFQFKSVMTVGSGNCVENIEVFNAPCSSNKHHEYGDGECNFDASDSRAASPDIFMVFLKSCGGSGGNYNDGSNSPGDGIPDYGTPGGGSTSDPSNPSDPSNNNSNPASPSDEDCIRLSNGACAGLATSPVEPLPLVRPVDQETQDFFDDLNTPLKNHINNANQNELRDDVDQFLIEENHDQPAKDFAEEAIKAKEESEDSEVDFENKSIYKKELPGCLKTIINKFKPTNEGISIDMNGVDQAILNQLNVPGDILQLFDNNENYGLKFKMEVIDDRPNGRKTNATTHTEINPNGSKMAVITFNTNYVDTATDLALARTAIHELLHAYMNYATRNRDPNTTIAQMIDLVLGQTFAPPSSLQHEVMARQLIGAMAGSLAQWDNSQQAAIEYKRLAWSGGMRDSDVFESLDPNEKLAIIAVDQVESGEPQNSLPMSPMGEKSC
jgi:hypothetical protein